MDAEPSLCRANVLKRVSAQSLSLGSTLRDLGWIYPCTARRVMRAGWQRLRKPVNASAPTHSVERLSGVSWICRRASWDKSERPYRACVNKKRAAQDENRAPGDLGRRSRRTTRNSGMVNHRPIVGKGEPFKLKSIRRERSPAGAEGVGWHRYVITQGDNTIVGHRQGSTRSVALAVEEIVLHLE